MIILLMGTNGSGKSTVARRVVEQYDTITTIAYPDRKSRRPMGTLCLRPPGRGLFLPGHYEIANGGMDTLPTLDLAYDLARDHDELGADVLMEGKNMSDTGARLLGLWMLGRDARVILVDHPVAECVRAVRERGHAIAEATVRKLYEKSQRHFDRLAAAGVPSAHCTRKTALRQMATWLELGWITCVEEGRKK